MIFTQFVMLTFTFLIEANHGRSAPKICAGNKNFILSLGHSTIDVVVEDTGTLILDFYNKVESDTIIENDCITADTEFKILQIWCDGIKLEPWFKNISVYRPRYFSGFLKQFPESVTEITAAYQYNFPGDISWAWQNNFWDWYFEQKNQLEVINFLDQDPDRVWKFRGSLDPCSDLVEKIKQVLKL